MDKITDNVLVVKVGTSTLIKQSHGGTETLDHDSFKRIAAELLSLQNDGNKIILVSSAAITAGISETGLAGRPDKNTDMPELQRLASIGWRHVLNAWSEALKGRIIGEILLTRHELKLADERDEAVRVIHTLLSHGDIAVVNENDTISHEEIAFGDNDTLSATLAAQIARSKLFEGTTKLIILSDVNGVYADANDPDTIIKSIENTSAYQHLARGASSANGTGGMITKFAAADIAAAAGVETWITNGHLKNSITGALAGQLGTRFIA